MSSLWNEFINYEEWVLNDRKGELLNHPQEYDIFIWRHYNVFELYRHRLLFYLMTKNEKFNLFNNFIQICNSLSPKDHNFLFKILNHYLNDELGEKYFIQIKNAIRSLGNKKSLDIQTVTSYNLKYEVDIVLEFLLSLTILQKTGTLDTDLVSFRFGKKKDSGLIKGKAVKYIINNLDASSQILEIIQLAYNNKLRNVIAHNQYEIINEGIESLDRSIRIEADEFYKSYFYLESIQMAIQALLSQYSFSNDYRKFKDLGYTAIISIELVQSQSDTASLLIYQSDLVADIFGLNVIDLSTSISINLKGIDLEIKIRKDSFKFDKAKHIYDWIDLFKEKGYVEIVILNLIPVEITEIDKIEVLNGSYQICNMKKYKMPTELILKQQS